MEKKKTFVVIAAIAMSLPLLFVGGCATGESYVNPGADLSHIDKVAVVDVVGDIKGDTAKNQIADYFAMELIKKGFTPVERAQVQSLLKEQSFQAMDVTSNQGAAQTGQILNASTIMVVNVDYGEQISMTAKMLDVQDGSMLWIGSGSGKTGRGLMAIAGAVTGALSGAGVAGRDTSDKTAGAIVGGVLGGVAGEALTPQQAQQAQKIIKKMCQTLPYRIARQ